jgi:hypothetical protein
VADNVKEAINQEKVGSQYVTGEYEDGGKIFRKRKKVKPKIRKKP